MPESHRRSGRLFFEEQPYGWSVDLSDDAADRIYWPPPLDLRERIFRRLRLGWLLSKWGAHSYFAPPPRRVAVVLVASEDAVLERAILNTRHALASTDADVFVVPEDDFGHQASKFFDTQSEAAVYMPGHSGTHAPGIQTAGAPIEADVVIVRRDSDAANEEWIGELRDFVRKAAVKGVKPTTSGPTHRTK